MRFRRLASLLVVTCLHAACSDPEAAKMRHLQKADEHMANEEYSEAILEYRNALKVDARFGEARYKLAEAYEKTDRGNEAAREYVRAAELLPHRADVQVKAGHILLGSREFERARKAGETALAADPRNLEAQLLVAHSLAGLKDMASAVREIEEAIELAPDDARPYTSLGTVRLVEGNRVEAGKAYRRAVAIDPRSVQARLALALFYWSENLRDQAEAELKEAITLDPKHLLANRALALFYLTAGRPADAEAPLLRLAETDDPSAVLTVADHYARTNRASEARAMYERLKANPRSRTLGVLRLASLDYTSGKWEQAHAALDEELKADGVKSDVAVLKARFLLVERKPEEAEGHARRAVELAPSSAAAHYALGLAQMRLQQVEAARKSFNETLRLNPRASGAELQLSRLSLASGKIDEALRLAENARKAQPGNLQARLGVARALLGRRDLTQAEAELKALRSDYPSVATVHALYGSLLAARSDAAGAGREFERALELDPSNAEALMGRVTGDLRAKKPAEARARVARAIGASPASAEVLVVAGRLEATLGDLAAAERHLRRAIEVNPSMLAAYGLLGQLYVRQNRLDEARAELEKLAARNPEALGAKTMIGMIYDIQNRPQDARRVYEEIVSISARAPVAANNLAWNYAESGEKLDMALQLAQSAKQQLPDSHEVDDTLGWVYYKRNTPELAIAPLERAARAAPENPQYHAHLGLAYAKAGRPLDARRSLQRALDLGSDFPGVSDVRTMLASLAR